MKVVHITPTYFDESSIIGGGERYPTELASRMSGLVDTTLVSFSSRRKSYEDGRLKVEVYPVKKFIHGNRVNPLSFRYLGSIATADIVHVHHIQTLVSDMACLAASLGGKRAFVTDYGGGGSLTLNRRLPVFQGYESAIAYSRFGLGFLPAELKRKAVLIKGGIDAKRFRPDASRRRENKVLYVGRILPHKGIDYLIEGFRMINRPDYTLRIVGRVYDEGYYRHIKKLAGGSSVDFVHDADDERLVDEYRSAVVTVLPSVHTSYNGSHTAIPELMGFTLLESQACGTPVICTDAGAMHEFVDDGRTGRVVEQNSGESIAVALDHFVNSPPARHAEYRTRCREWATPFDWASIVH
ncbi:MAG TPA: glycosyltransferase family 4 protein, partial [Blastocatellia bacterium]|nr:glycosyltransferase family 4 protein [Blastocatellia bacterium]